jgi:mobilome CxxCx(11)CxxC protein
MPRTNATDRICTECWERSIYCWATAQIFQRRARRARRSLYFLTYVGFVVPLSIGAMVLAFGEKSSYLPRLLFLAGALGVIQLIVSAVAVVYGWADGLEYSLDSSTDNLFLSEEFKRLGGTAPDPPANLEGAAAALLARDEARRAQDTKKSVSEKEMRRGHRASLRQFGKECTGCKLIPISMKPTQCPICGDF